MNRDGRPFEFRLGMEDEDIQPGSDPCGDFANTCHSRKLLRDRRPGETDGFDAFMFREEECARDVKIIGHDRDSVLAEDGASAGDGSERAEACVVERDRVVRNATLHERRAHRGGFIVFFAAVVSAHEKMPRLSGVKKRGSSIHPTVEEGTRLSGTQLGRRAEN